MRRASVGVIAGMMVVVTLDAAGAQQPEPPARKETDKAAQELKKAQERIAQLEKEKQVLRDRLVAEQVNALALQQRLQALEERLTALVKEMARKRGQAAGEAARPPAAAVEATVDRVDEKGLVALSAGSDAGLQKGDTLEVYRTGPAPKYLGRVRIVDVKATRCVAQPVGRLLAPLQKGDRVSTRPLAK